MCCCASDVVDDFHIDHVRLVWHDGIDPALAIRDPDLVVGARVCHAIEECQSNLCRFVFYRNASLSRIRRDIAHRDPPAAQLLRAQRPYRSRAEVDTSAFNVQINKLTADFIHRKRYDCSAYVARRRTRQMTHHLSLIHISEPTRPY